MKAIHESGTSSKNLYFFTSSTGKIWISFQRRQIGAAEGPTGNTVKNNILPAGPQYGRCVRTGSERRDIKQQAKNRAIYELAYLRKKIVFSKKIHYCAISYWFL